MMLSSSTTIMSVSYTHLQANWGYTRYQAYYGYYGPNAAETKQAEAESK